ncbi:16S rRNA (adenine(1518)-N(6)/adenine(1519)-N(6))-dimethyltransferase RsmA [Candidatus Phytoplasma gossypii]|uniref:Ribosomal RNA small subunit methyltransferase A n=1 Tax=Candidatus Phytoplasma gossypii TaxID=2982629 RepID=A0ABT9D084_9MOLU|nr:16S rRNA (adenine(1518)-N(6)/adenine(1519)-N(6))-dimethyltransferase RsmA ['Gossypium sp.' phytoplasma]MDO8057138.1 16S rRNA (adenine(1518)-N(6)/adenine(1519)-N(6))-dimethyltransferase RsmA ['Gossypium sp.' phytoplasma]
MIKDEQHVFKKKYGQNFLNNSKILNLIVESADIFNKNIVEIGPGKGALTKLLVLKAKKILAYEIDFTLKKFLFFPEYCNIHIIYDNFLKRDIEKDFKQYFGSAQQEVVLVGNLPYHIVSAVLFKIFTISQIKSFTIMLQKELAWRILSGPFVKNYNSLSVICQSLAIIDVIKMVKKTNFYPQPKVDGMVLKFTKKQFSLREENFLYNVFFKFLKIAFKQKRKQLINNFQDYLNISKSEIISFFVKYRIPLNIRAEEINILELQKIAKLFWSYFQR